MYPEEGRGDLGQGEMLCLPQGHRTLWVMANLKIEPFCPDNHQTTWLHNCSVTLFVWVLCFLCQQHRVKHSFTKSFNIKKNTKTCGLSYEWKFRFVPFSSFVSSKKRKHTFE